MLAVFSDTEKNKHLKKNVVNQWIIIFIDYEMRIEAFVHLILHSLLFLHSSVKKVKEKEKTYSNNADYFKSS